MRIGGSENSKFEACSGTGGSVIRYEDVALAGEPSPTPENVTLAYPFVLGP